VPALDAQRLLLRLWGRRRRVNACWSCRGALLAVPGTQLSCWELTVGGGLGLPSESSTFALVRLASCSSRKARSNRIFSTWRLRRARRSLAASFDSSTSFVRCLSCMHFRRYASSTEGGSAGGAAVAVGKEESQLASSIVETDYPDISNKGLMDMRQMMRSKGPFAEGPGFQPTRCHVDNGGRFYKQCRGKFKVVNVGNGWFKTACRVGC
jgi:hypothetical protein